MSLKWRKCRGWLPCVRRGAIGSVVAADGGEQAAENAKVDLPQRHREKREKEIEPLYHGRLRTDAKTKAESVSKIALAVGTA